MRNLLTICFSIIAINSCIAQRHLNKDTTTFKNKPIIIINGAGNIQKEVSNLGMDPLDIQSVDIPNRDEWSAKFGERVKPGIVIVTLKPGAELTTLNQLFDKFNIAKHNRKLPVFIDSAIAYKPEIALFQLKKIKKILINKDKETRMKYINIISIRPPAPTVPLKPGEYHLRGLASN